MTRLFDVSREQAAVHVDEAERVKCLTDRHYFDLGVWRPGYGVIARHPHETLACSRCGQQVHAESVRVPEGGVNRFPAVAAIPVDEAGVCPDCRWMDSNPKLTRPRDATNPVERANFMPGRETK